MPNSDTFQVPPIRDFVKRYLKDATISVDPFARNSTLADFTNDLNPETNAQSHMEAKEFLASLLVKADLLILDPPYSTRQISECYQSIGRTVTAKDTRANFWTEVRDAAMPILAQEATVLSFGWNTVGMGIKRGFEIVEIMLVCHGGAHYDTICMAEKRK